MGNSIKKDISYFEIIPNDILFIILDKTNYAGFCALHENFNYDIIMLKFITMYLYNKYRLLCKYDYLSFFMKLNKKSNLLYYIHLNYTLRKYPGLYNNNNNKITKITTNIVKSTNSVIDLDSWDFINLCYDMIRLMNINHFDYCIKEYMINDNYNWDDLKILFTHLSTSVGTYDEPILIIKKDIINRLIKKRKGIKYLFSDTIPGILNIRIVD
jgi:hypothetical protein